MAEATVDQVDLTEKLFIATIIEISALILVLFLTALSAFAALNAARAAQDSVKWMTRVERPRLVVERLIPQGFDNARNAPSDDVPLIVSIRIVVKNLGGSTGILKAADFEDVLEPPPPEPPATSGAIAEWAGAMDIASGEIYNFPGEIYSLNLPFDDAKAIFEHARPFHIFGWIRYTDIHGTRWRHGFLFHYSTFDPNGSNEGAFFQGGPAAYWYDTEEQPEKKRKFRLWPWSKPRHD